jgi:hypothetical protein
MISNLKGATIMLEVIGTIIGIVVIVAVVYLLIVVIPVAIGKLFFRWSRRRVSYVFKQSMSTILASVVGSLVITGLILLVGIVFKQQWAFSGGLLLVYTFWIAIKAVKENISNSGGM